MAPVEPGKGGPDVGVIEVIKSRFGFLQDFGFRLTGSDLGEIPKVRYESSDVFVAVYQVLSRPRVGFDVGLIESPRQNDLSDWEVLAVGGGPPLPTLRPVTPAELNADMDELARRLREYGGDVLRGDAAAYERAKELRRAYTAQFTRREDDSAAST